MRDFLDLTAGKAAAIAIALIATCITILRLISAYSDRRAMVSADDRGLPIHPITRRLVYGSIRREYIRVLKHLIILGMLVTMPSSSAWRDQRSVALMLVALGIMLNSILDYYDQRFALKFRGIIIGKSKPEKKHDRA